MDPHGGWPVPWVGWDDWRGRDLVWLLGAAYVALLLNNLFYDVWQNEFQWALVGVSLAVAWPDGAVADRKPEAKQALEERRRCPATLRYQPSRADPDLA